MAFDACARSFRQLRVRDDDEGASEAGGCVRVTVMNIVDSGTVCATRVAENARTSKSLKTTAVIERLTVGHFGWPIREKFS